MKITFIFPHVENTWNRLYNNAKLIKSVENLFSKVGANLISKGVNIHIPPLSLLSIISITPKNYEVELLDERIKQFQYVTDADIVAISVNSPSALRAFKISNELRTRNSRTKIVMGGMHPSICPDECLRYADSICIGEVEYIWQDLLKDFEKGELKTKYRQDKLTDPKDFPIPDYSYLNKKYYLTTNVINIIRGCSNNCNYCAGSLITGKKIRLKPLDLVEKEINNFNGKLCYIVDDNILYDRKYLFDLASMLGSKGLRWFSASPVSIGNDIELLKHLRKNGCFTLGIGLESIITENLKQYDKNYDPDQYTHLIKNIKSSGISVYGLFMFGGEFDTPDTFNATCKFIMDNNIDLIQFTLLTPYPGTPLFNKLNTENRILTKNWELYDSLTNVVFKHPILNEEQLKRGIQMSYDRVYSLVNIIRRLTIFNPNFLFMLLANIGYRQTFISKFRKDAH